MIDLTPYLADAQRRIWNWSPRMRNGVARLLAQTAHEFGLVWETRDTEKWVRIQQGDRLVAAVHRDAPLAILSYWLADRVDLVLDAAGTVVVSVEDWNAENYCLDVESSRAIFPDWNWEVFDPGGPLDPSRFSILDFWWATL